MEYSIITTSDKGYFPFLKILIDSVHNVCDTSLIHNFIIVDTGLGEIQKEYLSKYPLVRFVETNLNTTFKGGIWGEDWRKNVKSKTATFHELLTRIDHPLLMLDADIKVLKDLKHLLSMGGDVQLCVRPNNNVKYIGSYVFVLNPPKSLPFIEYWRDLTNSSTEKKAMESPSLVLAVEKFKSELNIVELPETLVNVVSPELLTDDSYLIHYKSKSLHKNIEETLEKRIWDNV